jgi:hypothetical protein
VAPDAANSGRQILAIAATRDRHVSAITMPAHTVAAMRGDFLDAYDLNFFIKTFDLRHEHFLMN